MQVLFFLSFLLSSPLTGSRHVALKTPISEDHHTHSSECLTTCSNCTSLFVCLYVGDAWRFVSKLKESLLISFFFLTVNSCPVCSSNLAETPRVGSFPVAGSKTTPREKTNNTVTARPERANSQTGPDVCSLIEENIPPQESISSTICRAYLTLKGEHQEAWSYLWEQTGCLHSTVSAHSYTQDSTGHLGLQFTATHSMSPGHFL